MACLMKCILLSILFVAFLNTENGAAVSASKFKWNYFLVSHQKSEPSNEIISKSGAENNKMQGTYDDIKFFLKHMFDVLKIKELIKNIGKRVESTTLCLSCEFAVSVLQYYVKTGASENDIGNIADKICTTFRIETPRVCSGISKLFKREVTLVLANVALAPSELCGILIGTCGDVVNPLHNWTIPMTPFPKPPVKPPLPPKEFSAWMDIDEKPQAADSVMDRDIFLSLSGSQIQAHSVISFLKKMLKLVNFLKRGGMSYD